MLDHGLAFDRLERAVRLTGGEPDLLAFVADLRRSRAVVTLEHLGIDPLDPRRRRFRVGLQGRTVIYSSPLEGALALHYLLRDGAILAQRVADTIGAGRKRLQRAASELGEHCPALDPELARIRLEGARFVWRPSPFAPRIATSDAKVTPIRPPASDDPAIESKGHPLEPRRDRLAAPHPGPPGS